MKRKREKKDAADFLKGGYEYEYSDEDLKKYMRVPTKWKLIWLEEINRITNAALTAEQKKIRNKIRKGEL